jgi:hypothetical protein
VIRRSATARPAPVAIALPDDDEPAEPRKRSLRAEVLEAFREARHGRT